MRLSEAMNCGRVLLTHVDHPSNGETGCALQIALSGIGRQHEGFVEVFYSFPWIHRSKHICPVCNRLDSTFTIIADHLNDGHKWNLDQIIDWVRSIEPPEPAKVEVRAEQQQSVEVA